MSEEAIAAERDTELLRKRRRSLADVCFEWMSRGDLVTVAIGNNQFEGQLTTAVNDLVVISTKTLEVAINTSLIGFVRCDQRSVFAGTTGNRTVSSFRAQLGRYEVDATAVRLVGASSAFDLIGMIEASTDDHVVARDTQGLEWVLPRTEIAYVISQ